MSHNLLNALKGKVFKEGVYFFPKACVNELLHLGNSTTLCDEKGEGLITSPLTYWEIDDAITTGILVTRNSAYHVVFQ